MGEEGKVFAYLFVLANVFQVRETTSRSIYATAQKDDGMCAVIPCMNAHSFLHTSYICAYVRTSIHPGFVHICAPCFETREGVWKD